LAVTCGTALFLSLGTSLLLPRRYTATTRILIDPPVGTDQRMIISPIYLESLKTYEIICSSDSLFLEAVNHFQLPRSKPIDQLKRSILKVTIARNTRILEISVTLSDAKLSRAFALYLAQQAVKLNRVAVGQTESDLIANAEKVSEDARARLEIAERAWVEVENIPVDRTATRSMLVDVAQAQREAARDAFEAAQRQLQEVRSGTGYRGERLMIVDPGVVPEQPSSPNVALNVLAAVLIGLVGAFLYLALDFNYRVENRFSFADWEQYREPHRSG
jgi:capsular polysaccharide biosynthesis protein